MIKKEAGSGNLDNYLLRDLDPGMSEIFHYPRSSGVKPITIQMMENF